MKKCTYYNYLPKVRNLYFSPMQSLVTQYHPIIMKNTVYQMNNGTKPLPHWSCLWHHTGLYKGHNILIITGFVPWVGHLPIEVIPLDKHDTVIYICTYLYPHKYSSLCLLNLDTMNVDLFFVLTVGSCHTCCHPSYNQTK